MSRAKRNILAVVGALIIVFVCVFCAVLVQTKVFGLFSNTQKRTVKLYFLDTTLSKLSSEEQIVTDDDSDILYKMVQLLIKGPDNTVENKRAIPENTKVISLGRKGNLVTVDFSRDFYSDRTADDMLAAFTVVYTLCGVEQIEQVSILVEGEPLVDTDKKPLGALAKDDIVNEADPVSKNNTVEIALYFPNTDATKLVKETRIVAQNDNTSLPQLVINELMRDSASVMHDALFPENVKLLSVETKDTVCFVNLSKEFLNKRADGESEEIVSVYAIVNSLTELEGITKVQFLIEGQKVENYGDMIFSQPFERNENIVS